MTKIAILIGVLVAAVLGADVYHPPTEETQEVHPGSNLRLAVYINTTLPVGDWKAHPIVGDRTMFSPLVGVELELSRSLGRVNLGLSSRLGIYDTSGIVGLGTGSGRIDSASAMSLSVLASAGYYLATEHLQPWVGLGLGVEWIFAGETINGVEFDFDNVFPAAFIFSPTIGLEYALSPTICLPLKISYDFSLNQVEGYGDFYGHGRDLVISVGLGLSL